MKSHRSGAWRFTAIAVLCLLWAWGCGPEAAAPATSASTAAQLGSFTGYFLPFRVGQDGLVTKRDGYKHEGQVDFAIGGQGTVCAAKAGTVVFVKESSNHGCNLQDCAGEANVVIIQHGPNEYSWYYHLAFNSVPVEVGAYVTAGTPVGVQGMTGWADGVHLHFMVSTDEPSWTDPLDPEAAPWGTGIHAVDFLESRWTNLGLYQSFTSANGTDISVTSRLDGTVELFAQGEDGQLRRRRLVNDVWKNWQSMGGFLTSAPDAASMNVDHEEVVVRGLGNEVDTQRWDPASGWSGYANLGVPPDGAAVSDPSIVDVGSGVLELFVRGTGNSLWRRRRGATGWLGWFNMGAPVVGGPDAMSWGPGHSDVFIQGTDGALWHRYRLNGTLMDWESMGQPPAGITSDPAAVCEGVGFCFLFVRGGDSQLWVRELTNGTWGGWSSLGGGITSGPDAVSPSPGRTEVWARGDTGEVFRRVRTGGTWGDWQNMGATP